MFDDFEQLCGLEFFLIFIIFITKWKLDFSKMISWLSSFVINFWIQWGDHHSAAFNEILLHFKEKREIWSNRAHRETSKTSKICHKFNQQICKDSLVTRKHVVTVVTEVCEGFWVTNVLSVGGSFRIIQSCRICSSVEFEQLSYWQMSLKSLNFSHRILLEIAKWKTAISTWVKSLDALESSVDLSRHRVVLVCSHSPRRFADSPIAMRFDWMECSDLLRKRILVQFYSMRELLEF